VVLRAGASGEGVVLVATAGAVLVPSPIVWIALGTTWTAVGIAAAVLPEVDAAPPVASG
jgi:hypothetical protein